MDRKFGLFLFFLFTWCVSGQIRILSPPALKKQVGGGKGRIVGSTATFGAPFYGDDVVGQLVYGESKGDVHCTDADYDLPPPETELRGSTSQHEEVKLINIAVVRRGKCSFTTKVKTAYKKGAHAVIIVDREDSDLTSASLQRIIVGDDGYGDSIHIPSILIDKFDGARLIEAAKNGKVVVELSWDVPTDHVVSLDLWMSSGSRESMQFLKDFSSNRRTLNEVMRFHPHYSVFSMPASDPAVFQDLCSDTTGQYCAEDPDAAGDITGREVLDEDVRQMCIHELTKVPSKQHEGHDHLPVEYAAPFWAYVEKLVDRCPLDGETADSKFGLECSKKLMQEVGVDVPKVLECFDNTHDEKLKKQRDHTAWSPRAVRVNGWRYTGMLDADLVTRAVCAGFTKKPKECLDLISSRNPFEKYNGSAGGDVVSFQTFLAGLGGVALLACLMMCCYKRTLQSHLKSSVREEVMLEVQAAMSTYNKLHGSEL